MVYILLSSIFRVGVGASTKTVQEMHFSFRYPLGRRWTCQQGNCDFTAGQSFCCSGEQPLTFQHSGFCADTGASMASFCQCVSSRRSRKMRIPVPRMGSANRRSTPVATASRELIVSINSHWLNQYSASRRCTHSPNASKRLSGRMIRINKMTANTIVLIAFSFLTSMLSL